MDSDRHYWFRAKSFGWGWTPATWQGWAILAAWCITFTSIVVATVATATGTMLFGVMIALALASTLILAAICYRTGEPPRWRWGR
jgi:hypothetical protein